MNDLVDRLLRDRTKFPRLVNRAIDHVADNPSGILGKVAAWRLGRPDPRFDLNVSSAPDAEKRVLIAPVNYSNQATMWAGSLSKHGTAARSMAVDVPGGFDFPADTVVPLPTYHNSHEWQRRQLAAVSRFSHVLIEAEEPLFGRLFGRDVEKEAAELASRDVDVAFMAHGTDIRMPSLHRERTPWSPYRDPKVYTARLESLARSHRRLIEESGRPSFFSTPDLVADLPGGTWCPVVIDVETWASVPRVERRDGPLRVVHAPSSALIKGTHLIEPVLKSLDAAGVIAYTPVTGVSAARMPQIFASADVVLDQFRLGSYGVAACEAMAAGAVVVGHVLEDVRAVVRESTGHDLPIVEATPDTIETVLMELANDSLDSRRRLGRTFVNAVHDGRVSAQTLANSWIGTAK